MIKLDIGSGRKSLGDYITVDKDRKTGASIITDIENPTKEFLDIYNGRVDELRVHHLLEHLHPENKVKIMSIFWNLLKEGGILDIEVPLFPHPARVQDPTHISFWCKESFWYFIKENRFGEAFKSRCSDYEVPLFTFIEDWYRGEKEPYWGYGIKLKKL